MDYRGYPNANAIGIGYVKLGLKKVMLTKAEAVAYGHIGINKLEELLKILNCPFVLYISKNKLIKRREFEAFIRENVEI